jgi:hypothetical protein
MHLNLLLLFPGSADRQPDHAKHTSPLPETRLNTVMCTGTINALRTSARLLTQRDQKSFSQTQAVSNRFLSGRHWYSSNSSNTIYRTTISSLFKKAARPSCNQKACVLRFLSQEYLYCILTYVYNQCIANVSKTSYPARPQVLLTDSSSLK